MIEGTNEIVLILLIAFYILQIRIVEENAHWLCVVPYWAVWPFETMLLPRRHVLRIQDLSDDERNGMCKHFFNLSCEGLGDS